jgi:hypothetical protein
MGGVVFSLKVSLKEYSTARTGAVPRHHQFLEIIGCYSNQIGFHHPSLIDWVLEKIFLYAQRGVGMSSSKSSRIDLISFWQ